MAPEKYNRWILPADRPVARQIGNAAIANDKSGQNVERSIVRPVASTSMGFPRNTTRWYGRWYVPVLAVAVAVAIVMDIAQRTGESARARLLMPPDNPYSVARGSGCEPGIGC